MADEKKNKFIKYYSDNTAGEGFTDAATKLISKIFETLGSFPYNKYFEIPIDGEEDQVYDTSILDKVLTKYYNCEIKEISDFNLWGIPKIYIAVGKSVDAHIWELKNNIKDLQNELKIYQELFDKNNTLEEPGENGDNKEAGEISGNNNNDNDDDKEGEFIDGNNIVKNIAESIKKNFKYYYPSGWKPKCFFPGPHNLYAQFVLLDHYNNPRILYQHKIDADTGFYMVQILNRAQASKIKKTLFNHI